MFVELQLSATLENIASFTADGEDFRWYIKVIGDTGAVLIYEGGLFHVVAGGEPEPTTCESGTAPCTNPMNV